MPMKDARKQLRLQRHLRSDQSASLVSQGLMEDRLPDAVDQFHCCFRAPPPNPFLHPVSQAIPRALQSKPIPCLLVLPWGNKGRGEGLSFIWLPVQSSPRKHMITPATTHIPELRVMVNRGSKFLPPSLGALCTQDSNQVCSVTALPCTTPIQGLHG